LWSAKQGKAEEYIDRLNHRHFELGESASDRKTVLAACADVGIDKEEAKAFLETDELVETVWKSYGDTIHKYGIHSIPLFVFNVPAIGAVGGPFRKDSCSREDERTRCQREPWVVNGSMDANRFLQIFEEILRLQMKSRE